MTLAIIMAFSVVTSLVACHKADGKSEASAATVPSARVAVAQRGDISHVLTLAGQFQPYQVVDVHPKVSGYMTHINVDIGDIVHQGETLAVLEVPELKAQLRANGVPSCRQSKEEIARAQHEINRAEALNCCSARGVGTPAAGGRDAARADCATGTGRRAGQGSSAHRRRWTLPRQRWPQRSNMPRPRALTMNAYQALHNYTNVTAPLDGVVIWRYADTGALIQGGTNSNESGPSHRPHLAEQSASPPHPGAGRRRRDMSTLGDQLQVRVDAIDRSFTGKIVRFTRDVNFETRTMETEVDVENKDLSIAPGMYANTLLQLAHRDRTS